MVAVLARRPTPASRPAAASRTDVLASREPATVASMPASSAAARTRVTADAVRGARAAFAANTGAMRTQLAARTATYSTASSSTAPVAQPQGAVASTAATSVTLPPAPLARGQQGAGVEQLQRALVQAGTLTQEQMNTGPGTFGPRTESALKQFQQRAGLPSTGVYDDATKNTLASSLAPAPAPAPVTPPPAGTVTAPAAGLQRGSTGPQVKALQDSLQNLGYLTPAQVASGPGTFGPQTENALRKFQIDHGMVPSGKYDAAAADWMQRRLAGESAPPPPPPGVLPQSATEGNRHFLTQFTSAWNPTGPSASTNCGPASLAMTMRAAGKMPAGLTAEQQVDYARALMYPNATPTGYVTVDGQRFPQLNKDRDLSGGWNIRQAMNSLGGVGYTGRGWDELDAALRQGHPVVADGYYSQSTWGKELVRAGQAQGYQGGYAGGGSIGHFNAILGKTADGKYVVADPMYTGGTVEMTREQLAVFFSPTGGQPSFSAFGN